MHGVVPRDATGPTDNIFVALGRGCELATGGDRVCFVFESQGLSPSVLFNNNSKRLEKRKLTIIHSAQRVAPAARAAGSDGTGLGELGLGDVTPMYAICISRMGDGAPAVSGPRLQ